MRVEVLALMGRYASADRRSGLVPPVPARSCSHTAARVSTWQSHPGCRRRRGDRWATLPIGIGFDRGGVGLCCW
jgi:hypothetical protein